MLIALLLGTVCWAPNDGGAGGGGGGSTAPATPPAPEPKPVAIFHTTEQLNERLDRHFESSVKKMFGVEPDKLKARLDKAAELEKAEKDRLDAQKTAEERLKGEKDEAEARAAAAKAEAEEAKRQAAVTGICAKLGIKNVDYAMFEAERSKKSPAELEVHFSDLLKDESKKSAFGIAALPTELVPKGATTTPETPPGGQTPPAPPPAGGGPAPAPDVMAMSKEQFATHLEKVKRGGT